MKLNPSPPPPFPPRHRSQVVDANPALGEQLLGLQTFGRLIEPAEIAATIRFCAESPVVNGAVLHANLGQVER